MKAYRGDVAVYRGEKLIAIGSAEECAEQLNVSSKYIRWMLTPYGKRRASLRKNPEKATTAVKIDG
ncbi:hypothetical protein RVS70_07545 [Virgibacillus sp. M23]|uniref:hypothetical protein n=1 Tax=Virgibacillus sp. M23 TaxID=3079030 RepID=UPI002A91CE0F|nr:hypothetical protein [Virgibacillus sp. M23]MDY7044059.1 hypothetical protein [Virgibacillus sp. M23]